MLRGFVEVQSSTRIAGWAWLPTDPNSPVNVYARYKGAVVSRGIAGLFRKDLMAAGIGLGFHGFDLEMNDVEFPDLVELYAFDGSGHESRLALWHGIKTHSPAREARLTSVEPLGVVNRDLSHHPLFVLGAARSATTAMTQALMFCTRYEGREEGHLFHLMTSLTETIHKHYNLHAEEWNGSRQTLLADVDRGYFVEYMKAPFISLAKSLYPEGYWIDKTPIPSMISMAPLLAEVWPSARFIFMKRRGLENLSSRLNKFASLSFEFHCHDWARCMQLWGAVRDQLVGRAIEIDQNCLNKSSDKVAAELSTLIGLDPEESTRVASYLREYFPERSADPTNHLSLEGLDWSPGDKELFLEVCGPVMRDFGYSLTTSYYLPRHRKDVVII